MVVIINRVVSEAFNMAVAISRSRCNCLIALSVAMSMFCSHHWYTYLNISLTNPPDKLIWIISDNRAFCFGLPHVSSELRYCRVDMVAQTKLAKLASD